MWIPPTVSHGPSLGSVDVITTGGVARAPSVVGLANEAARTKQDACIGGDGADGGGGGDVVSGATAIGGGGGEVVGVAVIVGGGEAVGDAAGGEDVAAAGIAD